MTALTDYMENKILDDMIVGVDTYLALFTSPTADDGTGDEETGGGYARQLVTFGAASGGTIVTTADLTFDAMVGDEITHAALFDAVTGGNMLVHGPLATSVTPAAGADLVIMAGEISFTIQ